MRKPLDQAAVEYEASLARAARSGDEHAFTQVVLQYQGSVFGLCARYLGVQEAEEAAQEAFVRAFVHMAKFDPTRPLKPWLLQIARNHCIDRLRKEGRTETFEEEFHGQSPNPSPEAIALTCESMTQIKKALAKLAEGPREALVLHHVEGVAYKDIAKMLTVPLGTVMTWIHRGRKELREQTGELKHA